ncbi:YihY/virulence factor BrkB family protein [Streptomyces mutabilis]|uniref:YihY/virulence factor BrkB family protein n=1 Tax=Streptomyces mutabilis TaxID=67332 RepID=UPI0017849399
MRPRRRHDAAHRGRRLTPPLHHGRGDHRDQRSRTSGAAADSPTDLPEAGGEDEQQYGPGEQVEAAAPNWPTELPKQSWRKVLRGTLREFRDDELADRAAAMTYYGILSLFPALLVLVSLLGLAGQSATSTVLDNLRQLTPGMARDIITRAVEQLRNNPDVGSIMAITGIALAVWSASGYVAAFIRTSNAVYDMPEGRPMWKILVLRIALTAMLMVTAVLSTLIVVFTGGLARLAGQALGFRDTALSVWSITKWPVLVILVLLMIAVLYWASPNANVKGFRWITPGSFLALVLWMIASAGFALYVAHFASYNRTYGTMAGVIVFLIWLWITNLAILLGLEFDAEALRQRAVAGGYPPDAEPYTQPRDTDKWDTGDRRRMDES